MKRKGVSAAAIAFHGQPGFRKHPKGKRKPDPSQNLHVEKGAPVTLEEVRAYVLPGCATCSGRTGLGRDGKPCACATRRFMKAHPEIIMDRVGHAWWPAAKKPAMKVADVKAAVATLEANAVPLAEALPPCGECGAAWTVLAGGEDAALVHNPGCLRNDVAMDLAADAQPCVECGEATVLRCADAKPVCASCSRDHERREACGV